MEKRKYEYLITSERADRRNDERENTLYSDRKLEEGDEIVLDGLSWVVVKVVKG